MHGRVPAPWEKPGSPSSLPQERAPTDYPLQIYTYIKFLSHNDREGSKVVSTCLVQGLSYLMNFLNMSTACYKTSATCDWCPEEKGKEQSCCLHTIDFSPLNYILVPSPLLGVSGAPLCRATSCVLGIANSGYPKNPAEVKNKGPREVPNNDKQGPKGRAQRGPQGKI
jgi:hypothetical protein